MGQHDIETLLERISAIGEQLSPQRNPKSERNISSGPQAQAPSCLPGILLLWRSLLKMCQSVKSWTSLATMFRPIRPSCFSQWSGISRNKPRLRHLTNFLLHLLQHPRPKNAGKGQVPPFFCGFHTKQHETGSLRKWPSHPRNMWPGTSTLSILLRS